MKNVNRAEGARGTHDVARYTPAALKASDFYIVTVPTPIDAERRPDLRAMLAASQTVGGVLKCGDIVVYESTVYPGAVEEDCVPVGDARGRVKSR